MLGRFSVFNFDDFGVVGNLVSSPANYQIHFAAPVCAGEPGC